MSTSQPKTKAGRKKKTEAVLASEAKQETNQQTIVQTAPETTVEQTAQVQQSVEALQQSQPIQTNEVKQPAEKKPRNKSINQLQVVLDHYTAAGWMVYRQTSGGLNDIIAHKDKKTHFVQVVTKPEDARYSGAALGNFIQNAMSNNVTPVHAKVVIEENREGVLAVTKVTFTDVNSNSRLVVSKGKATK